MGTCGNCIFATSFWFVENGASFNFRRGTDCVFVFKVRQTVWANYAFTRPETRETREKYLIVWEVKSKYVPYVYLHHEASVFRYPTWIRKTIRILRWPGRRAYRRRFCHWARTVNALNLIDLILNPRNTCASFGKARPTSSGPFLSEWKVFTRLWKQVAGGISLVLYLHDMLIIG